MMEDNPNVEMDSTNDELKQEILDPDERSSSFSSTSTTPEPFESFYFEEEVAYNANTENFNDSIAASDDNKLNEKDDDTIKKRRAIERFWNRLMQKITDDYYDKTVVVDAKEVGLYNNLKSNYFNLIYNSTEFSNQHFCDENGKPMELGDIVSSKCIEIEYKFVPIIESITSTQDVEDFEMSVKYLARAKETNSTVKNPNLNRDEFITIKIEADDDDNSSFSNDTLPFVPDNDSLNDHNNLMEPADLSLLISPPHNLPTLSKNQLKYKEKDYTDGVASISIATQSLAKTSIENTVTVSEKKNKNCKQKKQKKLKEKVSSSTLITNEVNVHKPTNETSNSSKSQLAPVIGQQIISPVSSKDEIRAKDVKKVSPIAAEKTEKVIKINGSLLKQSVKISGFKKPLSQKKIVKLQRLFDPVTPSENHVPQPKPLIQTMVIPEQKISIQKPVSGYSQSSYDKIHPATVPVKEIMNPMTKHYNNIYKTALSPDDEKKIQKVKVVFQPNAHSMNSKAKTIKLDKQSQKTNNSNSPVELFPMSMSTQTIHKPLIRPVPIEKLTKQQNVVSTPSPTLTPTADQTMTFAVTFQPITVITPVSYPLPDFYREITNENDVSINRNLRQSSETSNKHPNDQTNKNQSQQFLQKADLITSMINNFQQVITNSDESSSIVQTELNLNMNNKNLIENEKLCKNLTVSQPNVPNCTDTVHTPIPTTPSKSTNNENSINTVSSVSTPPAALIPINEQRELLASEQSSRKKINRFSPLLTSTPVNLVSNHAMSSDNTTPKRTNNDSLTNSNFNPPIASTPLVQSSEHQKPSMKRNQQKEMSSSEQSKRRKLIRFSPLITSTPAEKVKNSKRSTTKTTTINGFTPPVRRVTEKRHYEVRHSIKEGTDRNTKVYKSKNSDKESSRSTSTSASTSKRSNFHSTENPRNIWDTEIEGYNINIRPNDILKPSNSTESDYINRKKISKNFDKQKNNNNWTRNQKHYSNNRSYSYYSESNHIYRRSDGGVTFTQVFDNRNYREQRPYDRYNRGRDYGNSNNNQSRRSETPRNSNYTNSNNFHSNNANRMNYKEQMNRNIPAHGAEKEMRYSQIQQERQRDGVQNSSKEIYYHYDETKNCIYPSVYSYPTHRSNNHQNNS